MFAIIKPKESVNVESANVPNKFLIIVWAKF